MELAPNFKEEKVCALIWEMCRQGVLSNDQWAWDAIMGGSEVQTVFRLQTVMTNAIKGCPRELVEKIYY